MIKYELETGLYGLLNKNGKIFVKYRTITKINNYLFIVSVFIFFLIYYFNKPFVSIGWDFIDENEDIVNLFVVSLLVIPFVEIVYKYILYGRCGNSYKYSILKTSNEEFNDNNLYINNAVILYYPKKFPM